MASILAWLIGTGAAMALAGCGHGVLRLLRVGGLRPEARWAVSLAVGAGLFSYLFFALGHAGVINGPLYWAVFIGGLAVGLPGLMEMARELRTLRLGLPAEGLRWFYAFALAALAVCVLLSFISAAAPVSDWDSRVYHIGGAKRYIEEGRIGFHADDVAHCLFLGQSMLSLWLMKLGSDSACQVLSAWFGVGLLCGVHALARRLFSHDAAILATALAATWAFFAERTIQPAPDAAATMMAILPIYLLIEFRERIGPASMLVIGLIGGVSVAFRMNSALFLPPLALFTAVWWRWLCGLSWARIVQLAAVGVVVCLAFWVPWTARNYVWTGNPFYPFLSERFDGPKWSAETTGHMDDQWEVTRADRAPKGIGTALALIVSSCRFGSLGWALAPLAVLFREKRRVCGLLLATWLIAVLALARLATLDRYFSPAMPLAAVLGGYALSRMLEWRGPFRTALAAIASLAIASDVAVATVFQKQFAAAALGVTPRDEFLRSTTGLYDDFLWMNDHLPADAKVLVVFREEYYLRRPAMHFAFGFTPHIGLFEFGKYRDASELAEALRREGFTHFFFPDPEKSPTYWDPKYMTDHGRRLLTELWQQYGELVRHNPHAIISGRTFNRTDTESILYRFKWAAK